MTHGSFLHEYEQQSVEADWLDSGSLAEVSGREWLLTRLERSQAPGQECAALLSISLGEMRDSDVARALSHQIGQRLAHCFEAGSITMLANLEFAILLDKLDHDRIQAAVQANHAAQRILAEMRQPFRLIDGELVCNPGIGIYVADHVPVPAQVVFGSARFAMYQAIAAGKNTIRFYDPALERALEVHEELKAGLESNQFVLEYESRAESAAELEVNLRWRHPQYGALSHGELMALAESAGMSLVLGDWLLAQLCLRLASWKQQDATGHRAIVVAIGAIQFRQDDFIAKLVGMLKNAGAEFQQLKLALDESAWGDDDVMEKISSLKGLGIDVLSCQ